MECNVTYVLTHSLEFFDSFALCRIQGQCTSLISRAYQYRALYHHRMLGYMQYRSLSCCDPVIYYATQ